jgi:hypothetical protein
VSWPPIRPMAELRRGRSNLASNTLYSIALAVLPLLWLGAVIAPSLRRLRTSDAADGERLALAQAEKRLASAKAAMAGNDPRRFHSELAASLLSLISARLHEPVAGATQTELRALLAKRGLPEATAQRLLGVLSECDFARFSASAVSEADMQRRWTEAETLWPELAAFSPRAQEED